MCETITAYALQPGDVFRSPRGDTLRRVIGVRQVRYAETYTVLETVCLGSGRLSEMSLIHGTRVDRFHEADDTEVIAAVATLTAGTHLTVWKRNQGGYYL